MNSKQLDLDNEQLDLDSTVIKKKKVKDPERVKKTIIFAVVYIFLAILVLISIIPMYIVINNATRSGQAITASGFAFLPGSAFSTNLEILLSQVNIFRGFTNSLFISVTFTLLSGYFSALTAYGFYLYKFKGNKTLFLIIIIFMMIPTQLTFIGFVKLMMKYGFYDTYVPLIIPGIASIGTVFFLRQYASSTLSKEIIESARIDGANELLIFHKIGIPLMMPGIATMSIFAFIASWNNYLGALLMLSTESKLTLPVQLSKLKAMRIWWENQGAIYLGFTFSIVPIIIVFIFASRYLIENIAAGAVKG
jgi:multiple sugar transport system permease protein